jgi:hypothetical protein
MAEHLAVLLLFKFSCLECPEHCMQKFKDVKRVSGKNDEGKMMQSHGAQNYEKEGCCIRSKQESSYFPLLRVINLTNMIFKGNVPVMF